MYKFEDNQLSLTDFGQAVGLKLNPETDGSRRRKAYIYIYNWLSV